jgi:DHA2 family multidrug resistance protein
VTATNRAREGDVLLTLSPWAAGGLASLDAVGRNQVAIIGYADDFKLMMILTLAVAPLLLLLRGAPQAASGKRAAAMET